MYINRCSGTARNTIVYVPRKLVSSWLAAAYPLMVSVISGECAISAEEEPVIMLAEPTPEDMASASIEKPAATMTGARMLKNSVPNRVPII